MIWLSIEISTHQVKVIAINEDLKVVYEDWVDFEEDLPEFGTRAGAKHHKDGETVTAPTLMWVKGLDRVLMTMKNRHFDFAKVVAVSGNAQQHGSVYWNRGSRTTLQDLDPSKSLHEQLKDAFSIPDSPMWMDSSTTFDCHTVEEKLGGPLRLCEITGCRAYHRLTGNQVAKVYRTNREGYDNTERISLVSSFVASLLISDYAPIDSSDGSGMNLMDIRNKAWSQEVLKAYEIEGLEQKLGPIVDSCCTLGFISSYMVNRFGFDRWCKIIAFTGDNPASFAGMRPEREDVLLSLGTSDTLVIWLDQPKTCLEGMTLVNPIDSNSFIGMLCFKNGGLSREMIKNECGLLSWNQFEKLLSEGVPGNDGNIGIYFQNMEITPHAQGVARWSVNDEPVPQFSDPKIEVRALIEGQIMAKRLYAQKLGLETGKGKRILVTGGASLNKPLLQVISDVFNAPVCVQKNSNSASLGSAFIAKYASTMSQAPFQSVIPESVCPVEICSTPNPGSVKVYDKLIARYEELEKSFLGRKS